MVSSSSSPSSCSSVSCRVSSKYFVVGYEPVPRAKSIPAVVPGAVKTSPPPVCVPIPPITEESRLSLGLVYRNRDFSPPGAITPLSFHPGTANLPLPSFEITVPEVDIPPLGAILTGVLVVAAVEDGGGGGFD